MGSPTTLIPHSFLQRLSASLAAKIAIPDEVSEWLLSGINAHVQKGEPLERALGLARRGQRKASSVAANAQRDYWIYRAGVLLGLKDDKSNASIVARRLSDEIIKYETRVWPRRGGAIEISDLSIIDLRICLALAFHAGSSIDTFNPVPTSSRHITRLLKSDHLTPLQTP